MPKMLKSKVSWKVLSIKYVLIACEFPFTREPMDDFGCVLCALIVLDK